MKLVVIDSIKEPVKKSPGFVKKNLSEFKLDIVGLCGYGCVYCSSNEGNYLRINREKFRQATIEQLGEDAIPSSDPELMFTFEGDIIEKIETQLKKKRPGWGEGKTLVFSMLTDGFSPYMVGQGFTERALRLLMRYSGFRVRVLTKNAVVGSPKWVEFFKEFPGRFTVGLSIGTSDDAWAKQIEIGTSSPRARVNALRNLQDAGISTYGMLCPIFPGMLESDKLEALLDAIRPNHPTMEYVWAEPVNDRNTWRALRDAYPVGSMGYTFFDDVYGKGNKARWSEYAAELYTRLLDHGKTHGWADKLQYLLYEDLVQAQHAHAYLGLQGVLLQSKPDAEGFSKNVAMKRLQHLH